MTTLILGGEKSGKSAWALRHLLQADGPRLFVGAGVAHDLEMRERIREHRRQRPAHLAARETDTDLAGVLRQELDGHQAILVDSLDFWLFSCIQAGRETQCLADLLDFLSERAQARLFFVSSEIGLGPIQTTSQTRAFVRSLGLLNQQLAALSREVVLILAGLPLWLKKGA